MRKVLEEAGMMRAKAEPDWQYARRARQFLDSQVAYNMAQDQYHNRDKPPANCFISGVAMCATYSNAYRDMLVLNGIPCRTVLGESWETRGGIHCQNDVFLE